MGWNGEVRSIAGRDLVVGRGGSGVTFEVRFERMGKAGAALGLGAGHARASQS